MDLLKLAQETAKRLSKEKELMVAIFILDNPTVLMEDIILVQQNTINGSEFSIKMK